MKKIILIFYIKLFLNIRFDKTILNISPFYIHKNIANTKLDPKGFPWDLWFLEAGFNHARNQKFHIYGSAYRLIKDAKLANSKSFYIRCKV